MNNRNRISIFFAILIMLAVAAFGCVTVAPSNPTTKPAITPAVTQSPVINSFTADPAEIGIDDMATLKWEVSGVQNISIDQGVGEASAIGDRKVAPKVKTMYTLTATNAAGAVSASVTVNVVGNVDATKIGLTRDDVRLYQYVYSSGGLIKVEDTVSAYSATFVKGKETLTNLVYVYPTSGAGADQKYYDIEPSYRQNNQNLYSIGEVLAYVIISKGFNDDPDTYAIRFLKNNVWVHLGFISDYHALEALAKLLVSRVR